MELSENPSTSPSLSRTSTAAEHNQQSSRSIRRSLSRFATAQSNGASLGRQLTNVQSEAAIRHSFGPYRAYENANDIESALAAEEERSLKEKSDPSIVKWDGPDDPEDPHNWPEWKKWTITLIATSMSFATCFGSAVYTGGEGAMAEEFGVGGEVMSLGLCLYVCGFAAGPLLWGPASELYGRKSTYLVAYIGFIVFQIPIGVAQNLQTIFICRFFGGAFASSGQAIPAGLFVDFFDSTKRGYAMICFACSLLSSPAIGPVIGEFTTKNSALGWRWTAWFTMIMAAPFLVLALIPGLWPESLAPILLKRKAQRLRLETHDWSLHAQIEEQPMRISDLAHKSMVKPFKMLAAEPILIVQTLFLSLAYGYLYMCFDMLPFAFGNVRHWEFGIASLPFLGILVGVLFAELVLLLDQKFRYNKLVAKNNGIVAPEEHLPIMMVGSVVLVIGLFWFAWTASPSVVWVPQVISCVFIGAGIIWIFIPGLVYLTDVYLFHANSALAANSLCRSLFAAAGTMFTTPMFKSLRVHWAASLLGFLCLALVPFPPLLYKYGAKIRSKSKFAQ